MQEIFLIEWKKIALKIVLTGLLKANNIGFFKIFHLLQKLQAKPYTRFWYTKGYLSVKIKWFIWLFKHGIQLDKVENKTFLLTFYLYMRRILSHAQQKQISQRQTFQLNSQKENSSAIHFCISWTLNFMRVLYVIEK